MRKRLFTAYGGDVLYDDAEITVTGPGDGADVSDAAVFLCELHGIIARADEPEPPGGAGFAHKRGNRGVFRFLHLRYIADGGLHDAGAAQQKGNQRWKKKLFHFIAGWSGV